MHFLYTMFQVPRWQSHFSGKVLCLVCLLVFTIRSYSQPNPELQKSIVSYLEKNAKGYTLLGQATSTIGHRLTGTANGKAAESFVYNQLKALGIKDVSFDPFAVNVWQRKTCHLEIVPNRSDDYQSFEAVSLANTPSATGTWNIVDGSDGLEKDLQKLGDKMKGKCLMINLGLTRSDSGRKNLHRAEKVSLAVKYGAASVLLVHPKEADILLTGTASLTGEITSIPALCVSGKSGKAIREWMKKFNLMAEMKVENQIASGEARNVVARFPSIIPSQETVVFCGHLDSWDLSSGALDNGIGSFTLIDLAQAMQQLEGKLDRNIEIIWFMGEEEGLLGSKHLVESRKANGTLNQVRAVVNLDMTGNPIGFNTFAWPKAHKWFGERCRSFSSQVSTYTNKNPDEPGLHSDHQSFMLEGIPTFNAASQMPDSVYNCYHANCDNFNLVQPEWMLSSAKVHALLALELGTGADFPFALMKEKKLMKWLKRHDLKEKLEISGEWKWK